MKGKRHRLITTVIMLLLITLGYHLSKVVIKGNQNNHTEVDRDHTVRDTSDLKKNTEVKVIAGRPEVIETLFAATANIGANILETGIIKKNLDDIGDCKWVYDFWMEFDDEGQLPYASEKTFQFIKAAYDEIDFIGEFKQGNLALYDDYKKKYSRLIQNEVPFYDVESGAAVYINDYIHNFVEDKVEDCEYYFFDVDEDNAPELSIAGQSHIYVIDYNSETDEFATWYLPMVGWYSLIGSRKVMWWWGGKLCVYYQLDQQGREECRTFFFQNVQGTNKPCMVMIPEYADKKEKIKVPEEMKSEGVYERTGEHWYFRVKQEQYEELLDVYIEAHDLAEVRRKEVVYDYDELFGAFTSHTEEHN